jgi:hypothetical protein
MNVHARNDSAALAAWHANTARSASAYVATAAARVGASRCAMSPVSCRMRSISYTRASVQCDADNLSGRRTSAAPGPVMRSRSLVSRID